MRSAARAALVCTLLTGSAAQAWVARIVGDAGSFEAGASVAVDSAGDVAAGGFLHDAASGRFFGHVTKLLGRAGSRIWSVSLGAPGGPALFVPCLNACPVSRVLFDSQDDVIAGGAWQTAGSLGVMGAIKLDGATGGVLWTQALSGSGGTGRTSDVSLAQNGDVVLAGTFFNGSPTFSDFGVVRLDAASGAELWRYEAEGTDSGDPDTVTTDWAGRAVTDGAYDVIVLGRIEQAAGPGWAVVKLGGGTGAPLWGPVIVDVGDGYGFAVDAADDVVTVGTTAAGAVIVKLSGVDGSEVWRVTVTEAGFATGANFVALDGVGDVIVSGTRFSPGSDDFVVKLAGSDGSEIWRTVLDESGSPDSDGLLGMMLVPSGRLELAAANDTHLQVVSLDPASGAPIATFEVNGGPAALDGFAQIAAGPDGRVAAVGVLDSHFSVWQLSDRLPGKALSVSDAGVESRLVLRIADGSLFASSPGGLGDPTLSGATLRLFNPTTAESATYALPAANWRSISSNVPGRQTYKYVDAALLASPCKTVTLKGGKVLKAKCRGSLGSFTLDEAAQGTLAVRLGIGPAGAQYCARFANPIVDEPGRFKATTSAAPPSCDP